MERAVFGIILEHKSSRNVAAYQCRDVGSTRRGSQQVTNVATPQRRDISAISTSTSLKAKGAEIDEGIGKRRDEGTKSIAAATEISEEETCFCNFFFSEIRLMIDRLIKCITKSSMF